MEDIGVYSDDEFDSSHAGKSENFQLAVSSVWKRPQFVREAAMSVLGASLALDDELLRVSLERGRRFGYRRE